jgi:hypothetical protein
MFTNITSRLAVLVIAIHICSFSYGQQDSVPVKPDCEQKDLKDLIGKNPVKDTTQVVKKKNYSILVIPVLTSSPATGFQYGLAGQMVFKGKSPESRSSLISANALYTTKKQSIFFVKNNVYLKNNKIFLSGDWKLLLFSQPTYGLGTNAPEGAIKSHFSANGFDVSDDSLAQPMKYNYVKLHQTASFEVAQNIYVGGGVHLDNYYNIEDLRLDTLSETKRYTTHYTYSIYHGFDPAEYLVSGLSANFVYDSRDNLVNAYKGLFANLNFWLNPKFLGSDKESSIAMLDVRYFKPVSSRNPRNVLAFWLYGNVAVSGTVPYMLLPASGYDQKNQTFRGYAQGRFRGQEFLYGETEYRFSISPCSKILGGVVFASVGTTSNRDLDIKVFQYMKPAMGVGLRIMVEKNSRTNLQIDYAVGYKSTGLYFGACEAF